MKIKTEGLEIGKQYFADELAVLWECGGRKPRMALAKGIITEQASNKVIFLVTHGNETYDDVVDSGIAHLNGETKHKKDTRIISNLTNPKDEFHIFYRERKYRSPGKAMPYTYYGEYKLIDAIRHTDKPSVFTFKSVGDAAAAVENEQEEDFRVLETINGTDEPIAAGAAHTGIMEQAPQPSMKNGAPYYPHDAQKSRNALSYANFKCEVDAAHPSFIRKRTGQNYTEAHHLVPMSKQGSFAASLDKEENIVSLCSNCHNQIHYGRDARALVEILYAKRIEELEQVGISITLRQLLEYYHC